MNNKHQDDIWDLELPEHDCPEIPLEPPSYETQIAHACFLLTTKDDSFFEERIKLMNPEAFQWID